MGSTRGHRHAAHASNLITPTYLTFVFAAGLTSSVIMAMNHPTYVSPMQWFYPFGNTAAVSLSQDIPPGKPMNALLLGNGDPRNILFTLFNDKSPRM
jgi:hypothetical protein